MNDSATKIQQLQRGTGGFLNTNKIVGEIDVKQGDKIADFGCGSGYFTVLLGEKTGAEGRVYALDIQEAPLETVREKAKVEGLANIEAIRANLEILGGSGLGDGSQDIVMLANVLFQSSQKENIILEAQRILKDGGRLVLIDWKKGVHSLGPPESLRTDKEDLVNLVQKSGFSFDKDISAGEYHFGALFHKEK